MTPQQIEALERITKLKEAGTLTQSEFDVQKEQILNYPLSTLPPPKTTQKSAKKTSVGKVLLYIFLGLIGLSLLGNLLGSKESSSTTTTTDDSVVVDTTTASDLVQATPPPSEPTPDPTSDLEITKSSWNDSDINVGIHSFTIVNKSKFDYYDVEVKFTYFGQSETKVDETVRVIHVNVPAKGKKRISEYNAGFISQDSHTASVSITGASYR